MRHLLVTFLLILLTAASVAAQPATTVEIEMGTTDDQKVFRPEQLRLPAKTPVRLVLRNVSDNDHSFRAPVLMAHATMSLVKSDSYEATMQVDGTIAVAPHGRAVLDVVVDVPGQYDFECTMPGHAEWGMRGQITVLEPAS